MANVRSGQKWTNIDELLAAEIEDHLLREGGQEAQDVRGAAEVWRIRFSDATITYYTSGTLYSTVSQDPAVHQAWAFISSQVGPRFEPPTKEYLIGLDETGKGEVIGHTVLVGVFIPAYLASELESIVSIADTHRRRQVDYWDDVFQSLDRFKNRGLDFIVERIPPWHVDRYNLNKIMDVVYQRILNVFSRHIELSQCRVVIDDYGVGPSLSRFLGALKNTGADIVVASGADDQFVEARVASVLAKREQQKVIQAINNKAEFRIASLAVGSGNAGDSTTLAWLNQWKESGREWPWFVKRSFKTIRALDGLTGERKKTAPPIRDDLLSPEFLEEFEQGRLSITSLAVVCPSCGAVSQAALVTKESESHRFAGRCISCRLLIPDLGFTLRYYCGYILPDSNIILGGLLSKDLDPERSRFFEGFTILLSAVVRKECDTSGGKKELKRIAEFAAKGRIRLEHVGNTIENDYTSIQRDELILESAIQNNAILITNDGNLRAAAQAKKVFVLWN